MRKELLETIRQAESEADSIRENARREAERLIQDAEEAGVSSARHALETARTDAQKQKEEARVYVQDEINQMSVRRSMERELMRGLAHNRMAKVTAVLVERIVGHGEI